MNFRKTSLALAIAAFVAAPGAFAQEGEGATVEKSVTVDNTITGNVYTDDTFTKNVAVEGGVTLSGEVYGDAAAISNIKDVQLNHDNFVDNAGDPSTYTAGSTDTVVTDNQGNVGVNVAAGDNNQQGNKAAISAAEPFSFDNNGTVNPKDDAYGGYGANAAEARIEDVQEVWNNETLNNGTAATATLGAVTGNLGNIGVNATAGVSNLQKNNLAIASGTNSFAEASVAELQDTHNITTSNNASFVGLTDDIQPVTYTASLGAVTGNEGNVGVNVSAGANNLQANSLAIAATTP